MVMYVMPCFLHLPLSSGQLLDIECTWPLTTRLTFCSTKVSSSISIRCSPTILLLLCGSTTYSGRWIRTITHGVLERSMASNSLSIHARCSDPGLRSCSPDRTTKCAGPVRREYQNGAREGTLLCRDSGITNLLTRG